jgi:hypothetical protein
LLFDQRNFPSPLPPFKIGFALNRIGVQRVLFEPNEPRDIVLLYELGAFSNAVRVHSTVQIRSDVTPV